MTTTKSKLQLERNKKHAAAIREQLKEKNLKKLAKLLLTAKDHNVSNSLQAKGWFEVGNLEQNRKEHFCAIVAYSSARALQPENEDVWIRLVRSMRAFYDTYEREFSREDLVFFVDPIERMLESRTLNKKTKGSPFSELQRLKNNIDSRIRVAKIAKKTKVSNEAKMIFDAFRRDMTPAEVRIELAKIILPAAIDWIRENPAPDTKAKRKTPKRGSPPPPKDPVDTDPPNEGGDDEPDDKGSVN